MGCIEIFRVKEVKISVFLPDSYGLDTTRRFPLLLSLNPDLKVQESVARLHSEGVLPEMIVAEFSDDIGSFARDPAAIMGSLNRRFRLLDPAFSRWIVGMGHQAIVALQVALDHPEIIGGAACLSTSFEGTEGAPPPYSPMLLHLEQRPVLPDNRRLYFDYGTTGVDECYEPFHRDLGSILRQKKWYHGVEFVIVRILGGSQDPSSMPSRIDSALRWLATGRHQAVA